MNRRTIRSLLALLVLTMLLFCAAAAVRAEEAAGLKRGTKESIGYRFDQPREVSNVMVYWLDFDHYDGDFRVPESWTLYYKTTDGQWLEVEQHSPFTVRKDCYNSVDFKPVVTQELKIVAQLQKGQSGGVLEWKVNYGQTLADQRQGHRPYFEGYEIR